MKNKLFFAATLLSTLIIGSENAHSSNTEVACSTLGNYPPTSLYAEGQLNGGNGCTISPSAYIVKAHELGICTADNNPYSDTGLDTSGCFVLWKSDTGYEANLVGKEGEKATVDLTDDDIERPGNGSYKYGYVIIDDTIGLKASMVLDTETWHTTNDDLEYTESVRDEGYEVSLGKKTGEAELVPTRFGFFEHPTDPMACHVSSFEVKGTTISGLFLNSDKKTRSTPTATTHNRGGSAGYCAGSKYIAGVQTFDTPIVVSDLSSSAKLTFDTTDTGVWVETYEYSGLDPKVRPFFDIGPFVIRLTIN